VTQENPPAKRDVFVSLLRQGWVSVILDARASGVELPDHLRPLAQVRLDYGLDMPTPIADLKPDDSGIRATLSFNRIPQETFVPWQAVYVVAQLDGPGVLYPADVPAELAEHFTSEGARAADKTLGPVKSGGPNSGAAQIPAPRRPRLKSVPLDVGGDTSDSEPPAPAPLPPREPPVLRLVKS